jgi:sialate O-acetylesterase
LLAYHRITREWEEDVHHVLYARKPILPQYAQPPQSPVQVSFAPSEPGWTWNGMIAPLVPFAIRGVIWYQGESNAGRAYQYRTLFPALIGDWRRAWGQGDFPFLFVQLANYGKRREEPGESAWAELREAQSMTCSLSNTFMATAIDIGEGDDVHPRNKQEVGRRLALGALKMVYGKKPVDSGPRYSSLRVEGEKMLLRFTGTGSGLIAKGGKPLRGFAIAGADRKFVWAQAEIQGEEVVIWSKSVSRPVAARYAWADNPECTLYNREGLPALPFRTDDWPGITAGKQK